MVSADSKEFELLAEIYQIGSFLLAICQCQFVSDFVIDYRSNTKPADTREVEYLVKLSKD